MDLDPKVKDRMAKEMELKIGELESFISIMRTLRDEMEELYSELFGGSWQRIE